MKFPTWTEKNGQDDLIWYTGTVIGQNGKITIDVSKHNYEGGKYITHVYAYDKYNTVINAIAVNVIVEQRKSFQNVKLNTTTYGYSISADAPTGTKYVKILTWSSNNGQDDLVTYSDKNNIIMNKKGHFIYNVYKSDHGNDTGLYYSRIYAYDTAGKLIKYIERQHNIN